MSHKLRLGAIIIIRRNDAKTISLQTSFGDLIRNGANKIYLPNYKNVPLFDKNNIVLYMIWSTWTSYSRF